MTVANSKRVDEDSIRTSTTMRTISDVIDEGLAQDEMDAIISAVALTAAPEDGAGARWIDRFDFFVPSENPLLWVCINVAVTVYSLLLLEMYYFAEESADEFGNLAQAHYLVYDFTTTMLWVVQVGLVIAYDGWESSNLEMKIMAGIGVLFLVSSTIDLFMWQVMDVHLGGDALWTMVNAIFYVVEAIELSALYHSRIQFKKNHRDEFVADAALKVRSRRFSNIVTAEHRVEVDDNWIGRSTSFVSSSIPRNSIVARKSSRIIPLSIKTSKKRRWFQRAKESFDRVGKRKTVEEQVKTASVIEKEVPTERTSLLLWA